MRILIVEDDLNKAAQISTVVLNAEPGATLVTKNSYQSGLKEALETKPDLVILDMSMPTYDLSRSESGGRSRPFAGREILRELKRRKIPSFVIVVTQFESFGEGADAMNLTALSAELERDYKANYLATVYYQAAEATWQSRLARAMREARECIGAR